MTELYALNSSWVMHVGWAKKTGKMVSVRPGNFSFNVVFNWTWNNGYDSHSGMGMIPYFSTDFTMMKQYIDQDGKLLTKGVISCMSIDRKKIVYFNNTKPPFTDWYDEQADDEISVNLFNTIQNSGFALLSKLYQS